MSSDHESVAIFWDYENCEIPGVADSFLVTNGIRRIAHEYGNVKVFRAYLEVSDKDSSRSQAVRSDLQACGVTLIDCPHNGRKDVADKMMMVDILAHAIDNPPSTLILITGDRDFVYAVSTMRLRKYKVVLLAPVAAHASLKAQATVVYEWPRSVLQAEMPIPIPTSPLRSRPSTSSSTRPSVTSPLDRQTSSMIRIYSTPNTPQSGISTLPMSPEQRARSNSMQHHRSTSLPSPDNLLLHNSSSALNSVITPRPNYIAAAAGSASTQSPQADVRLSPAWRPGSKLAINAPVFRPLSAMTVSSGPTIAGPGYNGPSQSSIPAVAEDTSLDTRPIIGEEHDGDGDNATDEGSSQPTTPAATELSYDGGSDPYATEQAHTSVSALPTPFDDVHPTPEQTGADSPGQLPEQDEVPLVWAQVRADVVVPTAVMVRLRKPAAKFKLLVRVLERERLAGNTRVNFSQLGSLLRQEHPAVYQRAGCAQLKDYVALAEDEAVVLVGRNFGENAWDHGNKWVALHPVYHGRIPEPQPAGQYPPPPLMQAMQAPQQSPGQNF